MKETKVDFVAESTYIEPANTMSRFDGFYQLVKKELDYKKQCEMTPTWY